MDVDNDGDLDLLVGEKYESVHYYQRQSDGSLKEQPILIKLEKPDGNQDLSYMSISPAVFDWNNDGMHDIVLGSDVYKSGRSFPLRLYLNSGTPSSPGFDTYDTLKDNSGSVIQARCARVDIADINLDGKKDLIIGEQKCSVDYYKNVGTNAAPAFEPQTLIPNDQFGIPDKPDFQQSSGFGYCTPRIYDWNKDGKPDLLLSGYPVGEIWIYINDAVTPIKAKSNEISSLHKSMKVSQNISGMRIDYTTITPSHVSIKLLDTKGREINTIVNSFKKACRYQVDLNCDNIPNGMYLIQLKTDEIRVIKRVVLTK